MILTKIEINHISEIVCSCLSKLYENDLELIHRSGLERSLSFRFGLYFNEKIKSLNWLSELDLNLDLEYGKNGNNSKLIVSRNYGVQPDLILHRRGNNDENYLIIEFKGWWNKENRQKDRDKIKDLVNQNEEYRYGLGLLVELNENDFFMETIIDYNPEN